MITFKVTHYSLRLFQQTHLLNPSLIELGLRFYIATASWLNQLALAGDSFDEMTSFKEVEIPLPSEVYKFIVFCNVFQKKIHTLFQGRSFGLILLTLLEELSFLLFLKKVLDFEAHPLGVSSDLPWARYKYFQEPRIISRA